jgi:hypothetical protein
MPACRGLAAAPGWFERGGSPVPALARPGPHLVATPSLLLLWLISTVAVFALGGLTLVGCQPLTWVIAPAVAAVSIACGYGPGEEQAPDTWSVG